MKKNLIKNKAVAYIIAIIIFVGYGVSSTITIQDTGVNTITITDVQDTRANLIWNSNGRYYALTEANLATAIANVDDDGWVTVGADMTITSAIAINDRDNFVLSFNNHVVTLNGNIEFINITASINFKLMDVVIQVNNGVAQTGSIIALYSNSWANRVDYCKIENVYIDNAGGRLTDGVTGIDYYIDHNYTGISLFADGPLADRIDSCAIRDITMEGCGIGIYMYISGNSYCNGNLFENIYLDEYETGLLMVGDGHSENVFNHFKIQCNPITLYGLRIEGGDNHFRDILVWDWNTATVCPSGVYQYWIGSTATRTRIYTHSIANTNTYPDDFRDDGAYTYLQGNNIGELDYDADYDYKLRVDADSGYYYVRQGEHGSYAGGGSLDRDTDFEKLMEVLCDYNSIIIKFENGTFVPDSSISVDAKNMTFEGRDDYTTIIKADALAYGSGIFTMNGYTDSNITFRNLVFEGEKATDTSIAIYFSTSENTYGLTVENCIFKNWTAGTSKAIYVRPSSDDIVTKVDIINCEFYNCDYGIFFDGDADPSWTRYAYVNNNYFKNCVTAIGLDYVNHSIFSDNRIIGGTTGFIIDDCTNVTFTNNMVVGATLGFDEQGGTDRCGYIMNNALGCTNGYDINSNNYKPNGSATFLNFNFGKWT